MTQDDWCCALLKPPRETARIRRRQFSAQADPSHIDRMCIHHEDSGASVPPRSQRRGLIELLTYQRHFGEWRWSFQVKTSLSTERALSNELSRSQRLSVCTPHSGAVSVVNSCQLL